MKLSCTSEEIQGDMAGFDLHQKGSGSMNEDWWLFVSRDRWGRTWDVTVTVYLSSIFHNGYDLYHPVPLIWSLLSWNVWSSSHLFSELYQKILAMSRSTLWKLVEAILLYNVIQDIIIWHVCRNSIQQYGTVLYNYKLWWLWLTSGLMYRMHKENLTEFLLDLLLLLYFWLDLYIFFGQQFIT